MKPRLQSAHKSCSAINSEEKWRWHWYKSQVNLYNQLFEYRGGGWRCVCVGRGAHVENNAAVVVILTTVAVSQDSCLQTNATVTWSQLCAWSQLSTASTSDTRGRKPGHLVLWQNYKRISQKTHTIIILQKYSEKYSGNQSSNGKRNQIILLARNVIIQYLP